MTYGIPVIDWRTCREGRHGAPTKRGAERPHICTLFDVGRKGVIDFLVMELVEGETLAARIARRKP